MYEVTLTADEIQALLRTTAAEAFRARVVDPTGPLASATLKLRESLDERRKLARVDD